MNTPCFTFPSASQDHEQGNACPYTQGHWLMWVNKGEILSIVPSPKKTKETL